jgi:undecaprenyl-diphosphatase
MDFIINFDRQIFFLINRVFANDLFDIVLPLMRSKYFWSPLYLFIIIFFVSNYGKSGWWRVFFLLLTFAITDFVSASIFKELFMRLRPCNEPEIMGYVRNIVGCGSGYSFVSSHATNHFGIATFMSLLYVDKKWIAYVFKLWALIICYSQVYVGVHYPLDVICGALLGIALANFSFYIYRLSLYREWIS